MQGLIDKNDEGAWAVGMEKRRRKRSSIVRYSGAVPSGAKAWLQASTIGVGYGNPVSIFNDASGLGNYAFQGTASKQPTLQAVTWNRRTFNVVRFDSVDDGMVLPLTFSGAFSIFAFLRMGGVVVTGNCVGSYGGDWRIGPTSYAGRMSAYTAGAYSFWDWVGTTDFVLIELRLTPGQLNGYGWTNGRLSTMAGGAVGAMPGQLALASCGGAGGMPCDFDLAELLVYDRLLTEAEAVQVRRYFQSVYNFMNV